MNTRAAQKVLRYLLVNVPVLRKVWKRRVYYFSSASFWGTDANCVKVWLGGDQANFKTLRRLKDQDGLYETLSDTMFKFAESKLTSFGTHATSSIKDYVSVPSWKRALTFVYMCRFYILPKTPNTTTNYTELDYKFNSRAFARYMKTDELILDACTELKKLPETREAFDRKRSRCHTELSTASEAGSPAPKHVIVIDDNSTDDETITAEVDELFSTE